MNMSHRTPVHSGLLAQPSAAPSIRPTPVKRSGRGSIPPIARSSAGKTEGNNSQSSSTAPSDQSTYDILQAFFYGRALARTFQKRLGDTVADAVAEVSKAAAERPQRIREFQEEIAALARQDMSAFSIEEPPKAASSSGSRGGGASQSQQIEDPEAIVDDLRADIAYCRSWIQQMKNSDGPAESP
ncbi:hypothetical protein DUNSADRAFT_17715 [Dunaliella salina]|uniref:Uncharacterized protein n=1 Tax=Dunaliella salina TaxID=3046 RepID=A0ABQ7GZT1_DUNSA|nr:hypothetical protein DUNSADRAFT_17715 [Dunaliella salina]|eukprot:KAF5840114.1 hypothetical protein DUNSADRAFT_17715 [Dunaliella salina]